MIKQAPTWLPYRLRNWIDSKRIESALAGLDRTPPIAAASPDRADAEAHLLLCTRDAKIGVLALKSLLRFDPVRWAVTISDDGTLTPSIRSWIDHHLPNSRWLSWPAPGGAVEKALGSQPGLLNLYKSRYAPVCKLLHPMLLARCRRVLVVDPDTAFFKEPARLVQWAKGDDQQAWYLHDHQDEKATVPPLAHEAFAQLQAVLMPLGQTWGVQHRFFNSGLLAYRPDRMDLEHAEKYLAWMAAAPPKYKEGKLAIWFGDWTPEQTCYHVMFALSKPPPSPLGADYHLGGQGGHVFNHFLRHYLIRQNTLIMLRRLINDLG